jgi:serine/threonine protein kinase
MDAYNVIELVGEGSFGKVYKARRRFTGQIVVRITAEQGAACRRVSPRVAAQPHSAARAGSVCSPAPTHAGYQVHHEARQER